MKSAPRGKSTSAVEVISISPHGLWMDVQAREYFLPFAEFPWFRQATVEQIHSVELHHGHHLHWPALDIDLELDCLQSPTHYPLIAKS